MHAIHISQCVQWLLLRIGYLLWHALRNVSNSHRVMCLILSSVLHLLHSAGQTHGEDLTTSRSSEPHLKHPQSVLRAADML